MAVPLFGAVARPVLVDRIVYGTIAIASILIVYDGWAHLRVVDVVGIILGPVVAMFISHAFSATLAQHVEFGRRPSGHEWLQMVAFESRFLLLAAPPLLVLLVLQLGGVSLTDSIETIVLLEVLSLGFWAGLAAHRAGLNRSTVALAVLAGFAIGAVVLSLQAILQPGKLVEGGVAAGHVGPTRTIVSGRSTRVSTAGPV